MHAALERQLGGVDVFVHALLVSRLVNARSGEDATLDPQLFFGLAPACRYAAEDQDEVDHRLATRRTKTGKHKPAFSGAKLSASERGFDLASTRNALRAKYSRPREVLLAEARQAQAQSGLSSGKQEGMAAIAASYDKLQDIVMCQACQAHGIVKKQYGYRVMDETCEMCAPSTGVGAGIGSPARPALAVTDMSTPRAGATAPCPPRRAGGRRSRRS